MSLMEIRNAFFFTIDLTQMKFKIHDDESSFTRADFSIFSITIGTIIILATTCTAV